MDLLAEIVLCVAYLLPFCFHFIIQSDIVFMLIGPVWEGLFCPNQSVESDVPVSSSSFSVDAEAVTLASAMFD